MICYLLGKAGLGVTITEEFGKQFLIACCGVYGRNVMLEVLRTVKGPSLNWNFYLFIIYYLFLMSLFHWLPSLSSFSFYSILDFIDYCNLFLDFYGLVYSLCSVFFIFNKVHYLFLIKKGYRNYIFALEYKIYQNLLNKNLN